MRNGGLLRAAVKARRENSRMMLTQDPFGFPHCRRTHKCSQRDALSAIT